MSTQTTTAADVMRAALAEYGIGGEAAQYGVDVDGDVGNTWLHVYGLNGGYAAIYVDLSGVEGEDLPDASVELPIGELAGGTWTVVVVGTTYEESRALSVPVESGAAECAELIADWMTAPKKEAPQAA
ncbi:hypothetical protein [Kitasatospora sp. NPDC058046]|uniref:hypothetical protein n=1 Tax=Kitasatospora sp. NPDC058046 TaxID=3346312 RepID=UPI0036DD8A70